MSKGSAFNPFISFSGSGGGGTNPAPSGSFLLAHFDNDYSDSFGNHTITDVGTTFDATVFKFGDYSVFHDISGSDYMTVTGSLSSFSFGTGDFMIEFWLYFPVNLTANYRFFSVWQDSDDRFAIYNSSSNIVISRQIAGSFTNSIAAHGFSIETWHHVRVVRDSGTLYLFIDGVSISISNSSYPESFPTANEVYISAQKVGTTVFPTAYSMNMDELVVSNQSPGTGNFTPPTEAYTT